VRRRRGRCERREDRRPGSVAAADEAGDEVRERTDDVVRRGRSAASCADLLSDDFETIPVTDR